MGKVILDVATQAQLNGLAEITQLCDQSGRVIGYAMSPGALNRMLGIPPEPMPTEEELNAPIDLSNPGRPLEDILRDLREGR